MEKQIKIALAGNPNSGKTTLFNALTGSNQFVGNWPGVTVEKKEGKLKKHDDVAIMDLPGIYSLSPYTLEEVVARNYLITERPDAILNIIDGTNLERNLYLTTQLTELGIPVVIAINMMDVVRKNGDKINVDELSRELGCKIVEISALKGEGIMEAAEAAVQAARQHKATHTPGCPGSAPKAMHVCPGSMAKALHPVEAGESAPTTAPSQLRQWPVQIKLVPVNAPYFDGARLLIAADCTAYAYAAFHERFIKGHITLVGCPKLDSVDYSEKLTEIIRENDIKSVTVVRMEVPCCGGLELAAKKALQQSGKFIPWQVVTVTVDGRLVEA